MITDKKGYGIVIPNEWETGRWDDISANDILVQLERLNQEAFYSIAADVDIDLAMLEDADYDYDGISELAVIELNAYLSEDRFREVRELLAEEDYAKDSDFRYVLRKYNDSHNVVANFYSPEVAEEIIDSIKYSLRNKPDSIRELMELFIDEFHMDNAHVLKEVINRYGGHFVYITELESFLSCRDFIAWYRVDAFDAEDYEETVEKMKAINSLIPLYKLISEGGEFQVQSLQNKRQKVSINDQATNMLTDALALALKMLHDTDPLLSPGCNIYQQYTSVDLLCARSNNDVDNILESVTYSLDSFDDEMDLNLFYYLADNAIKWPTDITLTQRYLFLYKLAKFFKHVEEKDYDKTILISTNKEIADGIKYKIKHMRTQDNEGTLLSLHLKK